MGTYDEVHTGVRCGQTKALGKGLNKLVPGDAARIYPAPQDEEQFQVWLSGHTEALADSGQVLMPHGGYLTITEAVFVDWVQDRAPALPLFDGTGSPMQDPVNPDDYLYLNAEQESALLAVSEGHVERWEESPAKGLYHWLTLQGLDPVQDRTVYDERSSAIRAAAVEQLTWLRGEPGDCAVCAALREVGGIGEAGAPRPEPTTASRSGEADS